MKSLVSEIKLRLLRTVLLGIVGLLALPSFAQVPNIEGSYQFISRKQADGTTVGPPSVMGFCTFTKTHKNLNVFYQDPSGKFASTSHVYTYKLTDKEYTETLVFSIGTNQGAWRNLVYDVSGQPRTAPVTIEGGRIQFTTPISQRLFVFEGNKWTSSGGNVVDLWEKQP